ncbi:glycosyltransferase family 2 protein [Escherichia albertii]|uniref:Predicted glycosyltransferase, group II family n=1 Tax=Escherichia albertii TaxID=208962 RepID=A0A5A4U9Y4_ESCAL|nr:glycosyltransferase [Escherichia albertii]MCE7712166.1 glycosyltransferase [Escherichia albertii]MCQ8940843.1 glycosyltransferase [Escherichia albertii]MCQ8954110.1 glycosyltransferase [Escherichia albertii]MCQ8981286.1 glycosyltransferase [Escherichia albertii]MCQ8994301.1 glycosyltransferase [Escherichia albertii]
MIKHTSIDVLISTYGSRIKQVSNILHNFKRNVRYIICHQNFELYEPSEALLNRADVIYIRSTSQGVTKSRNILLDKSDADIIYFCDDDVVLNEHFDEILINSHKKYPDDVILFNIRDENGELRKRYPSKVIKKTRFNILSIGTIEISLKNHPPLPKFPEDMGAGTLLPVGDEAVFLSTFIKKGKSIRYIPKTIAMHPRESTGLEVTNTSIYSRGVALNRIYGIYAFPVAILFMLKRKNLLKTDSGVLLGGILFIKGVLLGK